MKIAERTAAWRRERRVLLRVSRAAWRLEQAERERSWALASGRAEGLSIRALAAAVRLSSSLRWASSLGIGQLREYQHQSGMVVLTGRAEHLQVGTTQATITLICDIFPDDDDQDREPELHEQSQ